MNRFVIFICCACAAILLLTCQPIGLRSTINELVTPPNWVLQSTPVMNGTTAGDNFGYSVHLSDNYAIVGAYHELGAGTDRGAAYIYIKSFDPGSQKYLWTFQQRITSNVNSLLGVDGGEFGSAVALTDDYAVVTSNGVSAIEIYKRNGTSWTRESVFQDSDIYGAVDISGQNIIVGDYSNPLIRFYYYKNDTEKWQPKDEIPGSDMFGHSVSIDGNYAIVGDFSYSGSITGGGIAYLYQLSSKWAFATQIEPTIQTSSGWYGVSVGISINQVIIGERKTSKAYFYEIVGSTLVSDGFLSIPGLTAGDEFGTAVSISGKMAVVGAYRKNSGMGCAYVFEKYADSWLYKNHMLEYSVGINGDNFGNAVAINENFVFIGASMNDRYLANTTGAGAAYLFIRE